MFLCVVCLTQQQLWRSVPQGDHAVGVAVPLTVLSQAEGSSQTKVSQLQDPVSGDQHVGCLHVPVEDLRQGKEVLRPRLQDMVTVRIMIMRYYILYVIPMLLLKNSMIGDV